MTCIWRMLGLAGLSAFCLPAIAGEPSPARPAVRVTNYQDGEVIRFPVPLIRGELSDANQEAVVVVNTSSDRDTREMKGLAHRGRFKALAELVPGPNRLVIRAGGDEASLTLVYRPQTNPYYVRCIYMTDNTGNTEYQSPIENDPQNYAAKLDTTLKIMQTFTAERNHDLGFGRRTFKLELDDRGNVKVHLFKCAKPAAFYYRLDDQAWYARVADELEKSFNMEHAKNVVVAAYTRFDPATGKVHGHTALGGGWMGLFGSGDFFTWPSRLADVQAAFMDTRRIDPKQVFSDSIDRHTFWGAASTTIGATLHELTHTFDIPHSREPMDIMTRGFDQFNRAFTFVDPPSAANREPIEFTDDQVACFAPISAAAMMPNPWFAMDDPESLRPAAALDADGRNIIVTAHSPVRYIGFDVKGEAAYYVVPPECSLRVVVPVAEIRDRVKSDSFSIRVLDDRGRLLIEDRLIRRSGRAARRRDR